MRLIAKYVYITDSDVIYQIYVMTLIKTFLKMILAILTISLSWLKIELVLKIVYQEKIKTEVHKTQNSFHFWQALGADKGSSLSP